MKKREGIQSVRTVPAIGSVAISFDPSQLPKAKLLVYLDALLANIGQQQHRVLSSPPET